MVYRWKVTGLDAPWQNDSGAQGWQQPSRALVQVAVMRGQLRLMMLGEPHVRRRRRRRRKRKRKRRRRRFPQSWLFSRSCYPPLPKSTMLHWYVYFSLALAHAF